MIFTDYKDKIFYFDILIHLLFSFTLATIIFIVKFRKKKQEELDKKVRKVLNTNIMNEISTPTTTDIENLKILNNIYTNRDKFDKVTNNDIKKASYNQIIIFGFVVIVSSFLLDNRTQFLNLLVDKIITFFIFGCVIYLYSIHFKEKYTEIKEKEIYDMLKKSNKKLRSTTTY